MKQKPRWSGKDGFETTTTALTQYADALNVTFLYISLSEMKLSTYLPVYYLFPPSEPKLH